MGPSQLSFILKLQDLLTPGMKTAASISESSGNKIKSQFTGIEYSGKRMGASVNTLKENLDQINHVRMNTNIKKEFQDATTAAKVLGRQIDKLEYQGKKGSGGGGMLGTFIKGNLISGAITAGLGMVRDFAGDINATMLKSSSLKTAINSTTGGKGVEAVAQTEAISNKYGLNYEASLEGVKTLTGGLKSMNIPLAEQMKIFEGVSTGIAAMKLGAEESKGAMLALGQMASKGVVSAEELRGQLGERIPGAFGIAAKSMNVTEAALGKMLQKGEIAAKDFLPRFAAEMQKTFGADALAAANGPAAAQERFTNAMFKMKASIGEGLIPIITPMVEKFTELATTVMPPLQEGISFIVDLVKKLPDIFSNITSGTSEWSTYFNTLKNVGMSLWSTVVSLYQNIRNIVMGVTDWIGKSEIMKDIFWAMGKLSEVVMASIRGMGSNLQWIWDTILRPILEGIEFIYGKVKGLIGGKTEIAITDNTPMAAKFKDYGANLPGMNVVNPNTANLPKGGNNEGKQSMEPVKQKADGINQGGQRSITINIGKQIEKIEQHIIGGGREVADEIENAVKEAMKRVVYSLNGVAS